MKNSLIKILCIIFAMLIVIYYIMNTDKVKIIRMKNVIDDSWRTLPREASDSQLESTLHSLNGYYSVMSQEDIENINSLIIERGGHLAPKYGYKHYTLAVSAVKSNSSSVISEPREIARLYRNAIISSRVQKNGFSDWISTSEVENIFSDGQQYCWTHYREGTSWFTFEFALVAQRFISDEKSTAILEDGMKYIGYNDDRDGSVFHEYGMALMRKAHRLNDDNSLIAACEQFDKSMQHKYKCGNFTTPLYSRKMKLEALSEYHFNSKNHPEFQKLIPMYVQLIGDWEMNAKIIDADGLLIIPKLYLQCSLMMKHNGNNDMALRYAKDGLGAVKKYGGAQSPTESALQNLVGSLQGAK